MTMDKRTYFIGFRLNAKEYDAFCLDRDRKKLSSTMYLRQALGVMRRTQRRTRKTNQ
jgi:hypothetical protein